MRPDLLLRASDLRASRTPFVLATVVRAQRPTSAKAGDAALILADGTMDGFVGGVCTRSTVLTHGLRLLASGESTLLHIRPSPPDEPSPAGPTSAGGLASGGGVASAAGPASGGGLAPAAAPASGGGLAPAAAPASGGGLAPAAAPASGGGLASAGEEGAVTVANPCHSGGALDIFLEPMLPPPLVHVLGDAPVARALVALGEPLGYAVVATTDPRAPIPPDAVAVVVASHGHDEEPVLAAALRAGVPYVALVASRRRGAVVLSSVEGAGRVHSPAGLDIGARTAPEVALSILAEIVATRPRAAPPPPVVPTTASLLPVLE